MNIDDKEYYKMKQEIRDCHFEMDQKQSYIGELKKEIKELKGASVKGWDNLGELHNVDCTK